MSRRYKSELVPPPDASGYVEMRIGGHMMECAWSLRGDDVTISHWVGGSHCEARDPAKGTVEDQARGMILTLWELNAARACSRP